jgi:hypothetical protein
MFFFRLFLLCVFVGLASHPASAASRVQFQAFYVSFVDSAGKQGQVPIALAIDVPSAQSGSAICSVGPRIRDTLLGALRKEVYRLDRQGKLDTAAIAQKIRPVVEGAVGQENVVGVDVSMDLPKVSAAAASGAFARLGCIGAHDQASASAAKK